MYYFHNIVQAEFPLFVSFAWIKDLSLRGLIYSSWKHVWSYTLLFIFYGRPKYISHHEVKWNPQLYTTIKVRWGERKSWNWIRPQFNIQMPRSHQQRRPTTSPLWWTYQWDNVFGVLLPTALWSCARKRVKSWMCNDPGLWIKNCHLLSGGGSVVYGLQSTRGPGEIHPSATGVWPGPPARPQP